MKNNQNISPVLTEALIRDAARYQAMRRLALLNDGSQDAVFEIMDKFGTPRNIAEFDANTDALIVTLRNTGAEPIEPNPLAHAHNPQFYHIGAAANIELPNIAGVNDVTQGRTGLQVEN